MSLKARSYIAILLLLGGYATFVTFADWQPPDNTKFITFYLLACLGSLLKVTMPSATGNVSFACLFVLIGVIDFTLAETLLVGLTSILIESVWRPRRPTPLQVFYALGIMAVAVAVTEWAYNAPYLVYRGVPLAVKLAIGATVLFIVSTFPLAAVISLSQGSSLLRVWQKAYFWSYPYYIASAAVAWGYSAASQEVGWQTSLLVLPVFYLLYRLYYLYRDNVEGGKRHAEELASIHLRTIEALALAIEAKDDTTHEHLRRVQVYACELGRELGLDEDELEALRAAAVLHDIGKLAVPEHIISKPGKLTPEEFEKMKVHPVVGAEILEHVQFPYPVVPIVRSHHEKWNGTGYPAGLRGEDIPIGARILAAVDALDALASDRQYRRALPLDEAMTRVAQEAGRSFDPRVVEILKANYVELERKAKSERSKPLKLSTNVKIDRGAEPAAGFEISHRPQLQPSRQMDFLQSLAHARRDVQALFEAGSAAADPARIEEALAVLAIRIKRLMPCDAFAFYVVAEEKLTPRFVSGDNYRLFSSLQIPMGQGLSGWVAENCRPIMNGNPSVEPGYLNDPTVFSTLRSALSVPVTGNSGVLGVLSIYHEGKDVYTQEHSRLLQAVAGKLGMALEAASCAIVSAPDDTLDVTTALPAGKSLVMHLDGEITRAKRLNMPLTIVVCHVEGLPRLAEKRGRAEADKAIVALAMALKAQCREFEYLARTAENEFIAILPGVDPFAANERVMRFTHTQPGRENDGLTIRAGRASYPEDGADADHLLAQADRRLFRGFVPDRTAMRTTDWLQ